MTQRHIKLVALLALSLCALRTHAALVNPSFETGDTTGWTIGGNAEYGVALNNTPITGTAITDNYVRAISGSYALWAKLSTTVPPTTISFSQVVDVVPGTGYFPGFSYGVLGSGSFSRTSSFSITINGFTPFSGGGTIGGGSGYQSPGTSWVAPANVTTATVTYQLSGSTNGNLAGFSVDNFIFQPVPEPIAVSLLLVPLYLLGTRRIRLH